MNFYPQSSDQRPPSLPTTCCMSGCANCVWLDYANDVVDFYCKRGGASDGGVEQILKESAAVLLDYSKKINMVIETRH